MSSSPHDRVPEVPGSFHHGDAVFDINKLASDRAFLAADLDCVGSAKSKYIIYFNGVEKTLVSPRPHVRDV